LHDEFLGVFPELGKAEKIMVDFSTASVADIREIPISVSCTEQFGNPVTLLEMACSLQLGYPLLVTRIFILPACCPWDIQLLRTPGAVHSLNHRVGGIAPVKTRHSCKDIHPIRWHSIVEVCINGLIERSPRQTCGPEILQSETNAILEVVSGIKHKRMPYHKDI
jgi:hypothetical protein